MTRDYASAHADAITRQGLDPFIALFDFIGAEYDTYDILEARVNGYYAQAGVFTVENVSLLVAFGGPNIWVDIEQSGDMAVRGYWGSDTVTVRGVASNSLTIWCNEYVYSILLGLGVTA